MVEDSHTEPFDVEQYRANTAALVESMDETTELLDDLSTNMHRLGASFEQFGETKRQLRDVRGQLTDEQPVVASD